jgi:biopolymer transport protein ExbB
MDYSLWEILNMGGFAMWIILAFSVLSVAVAIERSIVQWRFMDRARSLHDAVSKCLTRGAIEEGRSACERSRSPLADVYLVGYSRLGRTKRGAVEAAVNRERIRVMGDLQKRMWMLGTIGATAPFVGLFGTVVGIMGAFNRISETKSNEFSLVAGPIAEALIATAAGIIVAVFAVILYNYFNRRLSAIAMESRLLTDEFLELLLEVDEREGGSSTAKEVTDGDREAA